jgi:hypothetical protein
MLRSDVSGDRGGGGSPRRLGEEVWGNRKERGISSEYIGIDRGPCDDATSNPCFHGLLSKSELGREVQLNCQSKVLDQTILHHRKRYRQAESGTSFGQAVATNYSSLNKIYGIVGMEAVNNCVHRHAQTDLLATLSRPTNGRTLRPQPIRK